MMLQIFVGTGRATLLVLLCIWPHKRSPWG
jgi:hypothetical protein